MRELINDFNTIKIMPLNLDDEETISEILTEAD
jgi:hypothetical protein